MGVRALQQALNAEKASLPHTGLTSFIAHLTQDVGCDERLFCYLWHVEAHELELSDGKEALGCIRKLYLDALRNVFNDVCARYQASGAPAKLRVAAADRPLNEAREEEEQVDSRLGALQQEAGRLRDVVKRLQCDREAFNEAHASKLDALEQKYRDAKERRDRAAAKLSQLRAKESENSLGVKEQEKAVRQLDAEVDTLKLQVNEHCDEQEALQGELQSLEQREKELEKDAALLHRKREREGQRRRATAEDIAAAGAAVKLVEQLARAHVDAEVSREQRVALRGAVEAAATVPDLLARCEAAGVLRFLKGTMSDEEADAFDKLTGAHHVVAGESPEELLVRMRNVVFDATRIECRLVLAAAEGGAVRMLANVECANATYSEVIIGTCGEGKTACSAAGEPCE